MNLNGRKILGTLLPLLMLLTVAGIATGSPQETIQKSFDVSPGGTLTLETDIGAIDVRTHQSDRVDVNIKLETRSINRRRAEEAKKDFHVNFDHKGKNVIIRAEFHKDSWQRFWGNLTNSLRVKFEISVPSMYNCELRTSGGGIDVMDIEGDVTARTSGGSLHFTDIAGPVNGKTSGGSIHVDTAAGPVIARTSGGSIHIRDIDSDIKADTSGGRIHIERVRGTVDADTSGGSITIEAAEDAVKAHTSGGSITAGLLGQPGGECRMKTSGGSLTVYMATEVSMDVDAHATGGSVSTEFPVTIQGKIKRNELKAQLNGGGPLLYLRTSGGSIRIKKR